MRAQNRKFVMLAPYSRKCIVASLQDQFLIIGLVDKNRASQVYQDLPRFTKIYQDLPRFTKIYQDLPR
jgi:hypothetical protein